MDILADTTCLPQYRRRGINVIQDFCKAAGVSLGCREGLAGYSLMDWFRKGRNFQAGPIQPQPEFAIRAHLAGVRFGSREGSRSLDRLSYAFSHETRDPGLLLLGRRALRRDALWTGRPEIRARDAFPLWPGNYKRERSRPSVHASVFAPAFSACTLSCPRLRPAFRRLERRAAMAAGHVSATSGRLIHERSIDMVFKRSIVTFALSLPIAARCCAGPSPIRGIRGLYPLRPPQSVISVSLRACDYVIAKTPGAQSP